MYEKKNPIKYKQTKMYENSKRTLESIKIFSINVYFLNKSNKPNTIYLFYYKTSVCLFIFKAIRIIRI